MLLILSLIAIRFISTQQSSETNIQRINIHNLCSHYDWPKFCENFFKL